MNISATEFKNRLGQYLAASIKEPIIIEKTGRPASVIMSYEEYQKLQEMEDHYWGELARKNAKSGYLGVKETHRRLRKYAKAAGLDVEDL